MAPDPQTPVGMSSRLMTMKFMQRAAASASPAVTPSSDERSAKRRKEHSSSAGGVNGLVDQAVIRAALKDHEDKRQSALENHAVDWADTHWVLPEALVPATRIPGSPLNVVYVGFADIDASSGSDEEEKIARYGRKQTGNYKKVEQETTDRGASDSDSSDSSADPSSKKSNSPSRSNKKSSPNGGPRSELKRKPSAEATRARDFRDKRKKKEVKLNHLTAISSAGGSNSFQGPSRALCYNCGKPGHKSAECTNSGAKKTPTRLR